MCFLLDFLFAWRLVDCTGYVRIRCAWRSAQRIGSERRAGLLR